MTEQTVQVGERLAVSYDITNRGQSDGEQTVELTLDGEVVDSDALAVDTGSTGRMSLVTDAFTDEDGGQLYEVEIVTDDRVAQVMTVEVTALLASAISQFKVGSLSLSDQDPVPSWDDQVRTESVTSPTTDEQPAYIESYINTSPAVVGDGSDKLTGTDSGYPSGSEARTTIIALQPADLSPTRQGILKWGTGNTGETWEVRLEGNQPAIEISGERAIASSTLSEDENYILTARFTGETSSLVEESDIRVNQTDNPLTRDAGEDVGVSTELNELEIVSSPAGGFGGGVAEAVTYNEYLSGSDLTDEEQRIADEYGISL